MLLVSMSSVMMATRSVQVASTLWRPSGWGEGDGEGGEKGSGNFIQIQFQAPLFSFSRYFRDALQNKISLQ